MKRHCRFSQFCERIYKGLYDCEPELLFVIIRHKAMMMTHLIAPPNGSVAITSALVV
jgi:hypothetical protein